MAAPRKPQR